MFKTRSLDLGLCCLRLHPTRLPCAARAARPFATTLSRPRKPKRDVATDEATNEYQDKLQEEWRTRGKSESSRPLAEIRAPQNFHARIHPVLLGNIMQMRPLLRCMPVYDSTFDVVRSGKNLFIQAPGLGRWMQYLLPVAHTILESGVWQRRHKLKPDGHAHPRPSELLVICPSSEDANGVQTMGMKLLKSHGAGLDLVVLNSPGSSSVKDLRTRGHNILITTPEALLNWLALGHAKALLAEVLQDVQTLVVDGQACSLRRHDFLELLGAVMEGIPLRRATQRVIISDEHDPQLDGPLTRIVASGDYEFHHEPRLDEIQALRGARRDDKQAHKQKRKVAGEKKKSMKVTLEEGRILENKTVSSFLGT